MLGKCQVLLGTLKAHCLLASSQKAEIDQKRGQCNEFNKLIRVNSSRALQSHPFNLEFQKKTCELVSGYTRPRKMSNNQKCYFNEEKSLFKYDSNLERTFFNGKENQAHLMKRKERQ